MTFKVVGVDENSRFPARIEARLAALVGSGGGGAGHEVLIEDPTDPGTLILSPDGTGSTVAAVPARIVTGSYTLTMADSGLVIEVLSGAASTVTVPLNTVVAFPVGTVIEICQTGTGVVTIGAATGVTLRSAATFVARTQWATIGLRKRATNEWVLSGDLL